MRPYSNYVLFDPKEGEVQFREVDFDFRNYADAMRAKSIPVPPWVEERIYFWVGEGSDPNGGVGVVE